jgi:hypothetical protein
MRQQLSRQRGIGMIGLLLWLLIAIAVITVGLRLGPSYMEFLTVKSIMTSVVKDPESAGASKGEILRMIGTRLDINSVAGVGRSDFTFNRSEDGHVEVLLKYEVREHIAFNVDAVMMFEHREALPAQ